MEGEFCSCDSFLSEVPIDDDDVLHGSGSIDSDNNNNNNNTTTIIKNNLNVIENNHDELLEFVLNNMDIISTTTTTTCIENNSNIISGGHHLALQPEQNSLTLSTEQPTQQQSMADEESTNDNDDGNDEDYNNNQCKYEEKHRRALTLLMAIRDKYEKNLEKHNKITRKESSTPNTTTFCSIKTMLKLTLVLFVGVWCMLAFLSDLQFEQQHHLHYTSKNYLDDDFYDFNHNNILFVMAAEPPDLSPDSLREIQARSNILTRISHPSDEFSFDSLFSKQSFSNLAIKASQFFQPNAFESSSDVETRCLISSPKKCDNSRKVQLIQFNWLGPTVDANVAKIVLEEMLGICAEIITRNVTDALVEMAEFGTRRSLAMLEFWSESRKFQYDKYVLNDKTILDAGELGINAKLGWYILGFMKDEYELIDEYREYRTEKAAQYLANNDTSPLGRFIGGAKSWITFDQQIITNLKLELKVEYTQEKDAEDSLIAEIEAANNQKKPALFYLWYPHQIFKKLNIKNVYLPPSSDTCWTSYNQENELIDCDYPTEILRKLVTPKLMADETLNSFFSKFTYESTDQIDILADIVFEKMSVVDASCKWLRNNTKRVAYWVSEQDSTSSSVIGIVIASLFVISLFFCTVFVTGLVIYFMYRKNLRKRALKYAPRTTPLTLVFTDIQNSTLLWATASSTMKSVLSIHNLIMRSNILKFKGYEAKTAGDSFTAAFTDPLCALAFCISVQKDLLLANWPADSLQLLDMKEVRWNESLIYRGPRIRMGIHTGSDCNIQIDKKTQRMEYVGNMVHIANKIESSSVGGRIYCSAAFVQAIKGRLTLFDATSSSSNPKTSKEEVTTSANTQYYDDSSEKGLGKYAHDINSNLIEFEDLGPKQEIDISGTKISLLMVKDFSFPRTLWIQQFERVLEESPVEEQQLICQKLDLIEEIEKYITDPTTFERERKSKLIYDFINHTSESELNLPTWNTKYFSDLFDDIFHYVTSQHLNIKEE